MRAAQAVMADLAASGLTPEQLALVIELSATVAAEARPAVDKAAENKRAYDREYRRAHRKDRTTSYETNESDDPCSLEVSPQTPLPKPITQSPLNPPIGQAEKRTAIGSRLREAYPPLPHWMPPSYAEFRAMRKGMRNVPFKDGAERRCIAKLERLRAEGHDPEKLISKAIENGHRTFFPDETTKARDGPRQELDAGQYRERAEFFDKIGKRDDAAECRRKAAQIEGGKGSQVYNSQLIRDSGEGRLC